jgi:hypothetical protein
MATDKQNLSHEPSVPESVKSHPAWFRLIDQLNWYDSKSLNAQRWHKRLKVTQVVSASLIPATSLFDGDCSKWIASALGILIAVLEAIQQMNQYATLWFSYRATAERLKHEKFLFLATAGPYRDLTEIERLITLAERVEEHVSTEHANWFNEACHVATAKKMEGAQ